MVSLQDTEDALFFSDIRRGKFSNEATVLKNSIFFFIVEDNDHMTCLLKVENVQEIDTS